MLYVSTSLDTADIPSDEPIEHLEGVTYYRLTANVFVWLRNRAQKARRAVSHGKMTPEAVEAIESRWRAISEGNREFSDSELEEAEKGPGKLPSPDGVTQTQKPVAEAIATDGLTDATLSALASRALTDPPPFPDPPSPDHVPYVLRESVVVTFPGSDPVAVSPGFIAWWEEHNRWAMEAHRKEKKQGKAKPPKPSPSPIDPDTIDDLTHQGLLVQDDTAMDL